MENLRFVVVYCTLDSIGATSPKPLTVFDVGVVVVDVVLVVDVMVDVDVLDVVVVVVVVVAARQVAFSQPYSQ